MSDTTRAADMFEMQEDSKKIVKGRKAQSKSKPAKGKGKATNKSKGKARQMLASQMFPSDEDEDDLLGSSDDDIDIPLSSVSYLFACEISLSN
jgi:hypothetical protein